LNQTPITQQSILQPNHYTEAITHPVNCALLAYFHITLTFAPVIMADKHKSDPKSSSPMKKRYQITPR
jgi:hypothetical protein